MGKLKTVLLVVMAALFAASTCLAAEHNFKAKLTPMEEKQRPKSKASGKAEFKAHMIGDKLDYKLQVKNLSDANAAHIHVGKKGEDGPPVATLFSGAKKGKYTGTLSEGTITPEDLMGDYKGKFDEFLKLMRSGDTYVNVHTDANPAGEIRGQIK